MKPARLTKLAELLTTRRETVAIAESVTSGLVTAELSRADDATLFLQGGMIVYNLGQKTRHLKVDPVHANETNCVSLEVAIQMANEVANSFCSHWGIAITGYAVPVPALNVRSCFAYYAITFKGSVTVAEEIKTGLKGLARVQKFYVDCVLEKFIGSLCECRPGA